MTEDPVQTALAKAADRAKRVAERDALRGVKDRAVRTRQTMTASIDL